jgi:hypothetical protein
MAPGPLPGTSLQRQMVLLYTPRAVITMSIDLCKILLDNNGENGEEIEWGAGWRPPSDSVWPGWQFILNRWQDLISSQFFQIHYLIHLFGFIRVIPPFTVVQICQSFYTTVIYHLSSVSLESFLLLLCVFSAMFWIPCLLSWFITLLWNVKIEEKFQVEKYFIISFTLNLVGSWFPSAFWRHCFIKLLL